MVTAAASEVPYVTTIAKLRRAETIARMDGRVIASDHGSVRSATAES
jgi:hypothetical protein